MTGTTKECKMDRLKFRVWLTEQGEYADDYFGVKLCRTGRADTGHDCIVEQCTGLKDKGGKLIYEGDITWCKVEAWNTGGFYDEKVGVVKWGYYNWISVVKNPGNIEVIGNIHENSDLLAM